MTLKNSANFLLSLETRLLVITSALNSPLLKADASCLLIGKKILKYQELFDLYLQKKGRKAHLQQPQFSGMHL